MWAETPESIHPRLWQQIVGLIAIAFGLASVVADLGLLLSFGQALSVFMLLGALTTMRLALRSSGHLSSED